MTLDNDLLWIRSFITTRDKRSEEYGFLKDCPSQVLHHTIANVRSDYLHKLSTEISKSHTKVCGHEENADENRSAA
jgi:hypothetical protein